MISQANCIGIQQQQQQKIGSNCLIKSLSLCQLFKQRKKKQFI